MRKHQFKILLSVICAASCLLLTSCGFQTDDTSMTKMQKLRIGSDIYPPFVFLDSNGKASGIDVDIAKTAFAGLGYEAEFEIIDWEEKKTLVENGDIDCIWGCFSMSGRESDYNWAGPYMVSRQMVAVNQSSDIYTFDDLKDKTVMVQTTSKPEEILLSGMDKRIPHIEELISTEDRAVQYAALGCGYVDAIAAHETAILKYMSDYNADFRFIEEPLLVTGIGVAFSKEDERGLSEALNEELKIMREDGSMAEIIGRYLNDPDKYLEVGSLE